jgi:hypothetical protein
MSVILAVVLAPPLAARTALAASRIAYPQAEWTTMLRRSCGPPFLLREFTPSSATLYMGKVGACVEGLLVADYRALSAALARISDGRGRS